VLVDPGDVSKLERALDDLLGDEHLRRRLGEAGRQRAQMEFSVTGQARRLLHHLKAAS
jgi:glycosyltransferase involved in cell wall biosynthesis